jgi:hypothetical protein
MFSFRPFCIVAAVFACAATFCLPARAQLEKRITTHLLQSADDAGIAVADFNHDGKLDVVAVEKEVQIFLGNGDGTFQSPINYAVGVNPNSVAVADFNGDGKLDIAATNYLSGTISVLMGNGDGSFQPPMTLNALSMPSGIQAGDFNGDGKPDIALINVNLNINKDFISVYLNNGDGTFGKPINTGLGAKIGIDALGFGDFDRDGTLDLAVATNTLTAGQVVILLGNGDGTFTQGESYAGPPNCIFIAVGDLRGNSSLDLAVTDYLGVHVQVFLGNGDGTFQPPVFYASTFSDWAAVADFNEDGKPDLIVSNGGFNGYLSGTVSILLGNGDGTFQPQMVFPAAASSDVAAVGDFNGDHKLDVVDLDRHLGYMVTLLNTGAAVFSPSSPLRFRDQLIGATSPPQTVTLTNSGNVAMNIDSVTCSGTPFQMTQNNCQGSLGPGAHCSMSANFTAQSKGLVAGTLTIRDSASSKPQVVELIGTGTVVELSPPQLVFPSQKVGTKSAPQMIRLTNTGSLVLSITDSIFVDGKDYNAFSESDDCGSQLSPGASCTITITFIPHRKGTNSAYVRIDDDGGGSPQEPMLTGTGD